MLDDIVLGKYSELEVRIYENMGARQGVFDRLMGGLMG